MRSLVQNHTEAFRYSYLGCEYIKKTHLFIPSVSFPCNKFQFLLLSSSLLSPQFRKQKLGVKKDIGKWPPVPGWGWGCLCSLGLGAKFNQTGSRRTSKHRNLAQPDTAPALCGVFLRPHPSSCSEVGRKMGIESSGHLQEALGKSPSLSPSPSPSSVERGK